MISEESCDPEVWSNDAENPALLYKYHILNISKWKTLLNYNTIFYNITVSNKFSLCEHINMLKY